MSTEAPKKRGRGQPAHAPTAESRALVGLAQAIGLDHHVTAMLVGITAKTLRRHYKAELTLGSAKLLLKAGTVIASRLNKGDLGAACFVMKCKGGWRETNVHELHGKGGETLSPPVFNFTMINGGPGIAPEKDAPELTNADPDVEVSGKPTEH